MNVLVTSTPGVGHLFPLVPLAQALRDSGSEVTWALAPSACERISRLGFSCVPCGPEQGAVVEARRSAEPQFFDAFFHLPPRDRRRALFPGFAAYAAPLMLAELPDVIGRCEPDLVIHEPLEFAAAPAAASAGLPHITIGFGGFIPDSILREHRGLLVELWGRVGLPAPDDGGLYDHLYLHPFPPGLTTESGKPNVHQIRPAGLDEADATPQWLTSLGRDRPLVYVTFGTEVAAMAPLDVLVPVIGELDVDGVLTTGASIDQSGFTATPENLRVESWVPQQLLLERASLLISHAGSGATLGAAALGVPHLCLPIAADQFENADAVTAAGAGLMLEPDEISSATLRRCSQEVLTDPRFARGAQRLSDEIALMPEPSERVQLLEALVR